MGSNFSSLHSEELSKLGCSGVNFVYQVQNVVGLILTKINFQNTYMSELRTSKYPLKGQLMKGQKSYNLLFVLLHRYRVYLSRLFQIESEPNLHIPC